MSEDEWKIDETLHGDASANADYHDEVARLQTENRTVSALQAENAQLRQQNAALAAALAVANAALEDAFRLVNNGSTATKEWDVFKRACNALSVLNQQDHYAVLAARDAESERRGAVKALKRVIQSVKAQSFPHDVVWEVAFLEGLLGKIESGEVKP